MRLGKFRSNYENYHALWNTRVTRKKKEKGKSFAHPAGVVTSKKLVSRAEKGGGGLAGRDEGGAFDRGSSPEGQSRGGEREVTS